MRLLVLAAVLAAAAFLAQAAVLQAAVPQDGIDRSAPAATPATALAAPAPADERGTPLEGLERLSCQRCHADVVAEWATTLHGKAWVDAPYQEELADARRPESCHGCHIPEPLHLQLDASGAIPQKPRARDATARDAPLADVDAHFGVSCESCHRGPDGTILGPWGAATDAHRSVKHPSFGPESHSALCIACHATTVGPVIGIAKDFVDTEQHARGRSCVGCHMAPVERPAASEPGQPPLPPRAGRSHALQTPRDPGFLARAFDLSVEQREGAVVLVVANACGHRVPGRVGRVLTLEAELLDASGAVVAQAAHAIETKRSLPADGRVELVLRGAGARVRVRGEHDAPALDDTVVFLERTLAVP